METLHEVARASAPKSDVERAAHARAVVQHTASETAAALDRVDRALCGLLDVKRSGRALAALMEAAALILIAEDEIRVLLERPRLHDDALAGSA
jgi:hypothetical protein